MAPNHTSHWTGGRLRRLVLLALLAALLAGLPIGRPFPVRAAAVLTITPTTWNLVGLDSNNVDVGPNTFPVGARVCNTGDTAAANVTTQLVWDGTDPYINLAGLETLTRSTLAAGACADFYYTLTITRDDDAVLSVRPFHINASATGVAAVSTPSNREIWVDYLERNNALIAGRVTGPAVMPVGGTAQYVVTAGSIPQLEQVSNTINFPSSMFRVTGIKASYTSPASFKTDAPYVDACGWDDDLNSVDYLSCVGPALTGTPGQVGGSFVLTYTVDVIATGVFTLTNVVYGFSDADNVFYYNTSAPGDVLRVTAQTGSTATPTNTGVPTVTTTPGTPGAPTATTSLPVLKVENSVNPTQARYNQTMVFTVRITNNGQSSALNLNFTDSFSAYLDIGTYTSSRGTVNANQSTRTVTGALGNLNPGENVVVTISMKVNQTAKSNISLTNYATVTYSTGSSTQTATSNTTSFRVLGTTTLPGTGGMELDRPAEGRSPFVPALLSSLLLGFLGLFALAYGLLARGSRPAWAGWFARIGLLLVAAGLIFGLGAWALGRPAGGVSPLVVRPAIGLAPGEEAQPAPTERVRKPRRPSQEATDTPTEPPKPTLAPQGTPAPQDDPQDASPIIRVEIPALQVDSDVQYVPFDGLTWVVQNLQSQVAWLGNSQGPGAGGNTALAGHVTLRTGADGPFRYLDSLSPGDRITVYTAENVYSYRVREQRLVEDMDLSVMNVSTPNQLTLITCAGWNGDLRQYLSRVVVFADQVKVEPVKDRTLSN